jgi:hypothetical protein
MVAEPERISRFGEHHRIAAIYDDALHGVHQHRGPHGSKAPRPGRRRERQRDLRPGTLRQSQHDGQKRLEERANLPLDTECRRIGIGGAEGRRAYVHVHEARRGYQARIPEAGGLTETTAEHESVPRLVPLNVRRRSLMSAGAGDAGVERVALGKHSLGAGCAHHAGPEVLGQREHRVGSVTRAIADP